MPGTKGAESDPPDVFIKLAIAASEATFPVFTREAYPDDWAMIQLLLGRDYANEKLGATAESLDRAIVASRAALTVYTRDAYPAKHRLAARNLGELYLKKHEWRKADEIFASAREAFLMLFGQGINEAETRDAISDELFSDAAFAAAQLSAYAQRAVKEGRLPRELRGAMTRDVASRGLVDAVVALIGGRDASGTADGGDASKRPFAHPYYWAGFILTGL